MSRIVSLRRLLALVMVCVLSSACERAVAPLEPDVAIPVSPLLHVNGQVFSSSVDHIHFMDAAGNSHYYFAHFDSEGRMSQMDMYVNGVLHGFVYPEWSGSQVIGHTMTTPGGAWVRLDEHASPTDWSTDSDTGGGIGHPRQPVLEPGQFWSMSYDPCSSSFTLFRRYAFASGAMIGATGLAFGVSIKTGGMMAGFSWLVAAGAAEHWYETVRLLDFCSKQKRDGERGPVAVPNY